MIISTGLVVLAAAAASAASAAMPAPTLVEPVWIAEGQFCEPETVLPMPDGHLLVSNVCDYRTDGTGYLTELSALGEVLTPKRIEGLDAPLGMARRGQRLYVVDRNSVRVYVGVDLSAERVIPLPSRVANDIAVGADGSLFVTDTAAGHVYLVRPSEEVSTLTPQPVFPGANGIAIDGDVLWVGGERLWRIELASLEISVVGPSWLEDIDGIEVVDGQVLQVTPVGGPLVQLVNGAVSSVTAVEGVGSANHGYQPSTGLVLIPTGYDNQVVAFRSPDLAKHPVKGSR
ncbi:MAG: hypothetical protein AAGA68_09890 [Pseudomonadota bacterium]